MSTAPLHSPLKIAALLTLIGTLAGWTLGGSHVGWTQTSVVEMQFDAITEISYPVRHDAFVPGLEILGAGVLIAFLLGGLSVLLHMRRE